MHYGDKPQTPPSRGHHWKRNGGRGWKRIDTLEDNTLGYDIRSFDWSGDKIVTRLIEVKSSKSDTIFITRNEWQNAAGAAPHYCFHVWKIPEARVLEYSVAAIMPHIPLDRGAGEWREVCVFLEAT